MKSFLMNTYNRKKVSFTKGEGVYLWDDKNNKYLDALCGLAVTSLGHSHPEISKVIYDQSKTLIHTSNAFIIKQQEKLAERLCKLSGLENAFFIANKIIEKKLSVRQTEKFAKIFKTSKKTTFTKQLNV